jgi:hypothetical protein
MRSGGFTSILLLALLGCDAGPPPLSLADATSCLERKLPGRIGFTEGPEGHHLIVDPDNPPYGTGLVWFVPEVGEAARIASSREAPRSMFWPLFGAGGIVRKGTVVIEYPPHAKPDVAVAAAFRSCLGVS